MNQSSDISLVDLGRVLGHWVHMWLVFIKRVKLEKM